MNEKDYLTAIEEMTIPTSKILIWTDIVKQKFRKEYESASPELFDKITQATHKLADLIAKFRLGIPSMTPEVFTHILSGPIMSIRDNTLLIITMHKEPGKDDRNEDEKEFVRYLTKILSAAEYLSSLDRDMVLKMMLDRPSAQE